jgi:hypothetical protein
MHKESLMEIKEIIDELDKIYSELSGSKKRKKYKNTLKGIRKLSQFLNKNKNETTLKTVIISFVIMGILSLYMKNLSPLILPMILILIINSKKIIKKRAVNLIDKYEMDKNNLEVLYKESKVYDSPIHKAFAYSVIAYVLPLFFAVNILNGGQMFKSQSVYLAKKYIINPKVGDWVEYEVPKSIDEKCYEQNNKIGKINDIRNGEYHITMESYSGCDSSFLGYFNANIRSIIYPQYDITVFYPWLSYIDKLKNKQPRAPINKSSYAFLKEKFLYFKVKANYFNMEKAFGGQRNYYVKRVVFSDENRINYEVLLSFGSSNGMLYQFDVKKKNRNIFDIDFKKRPSKSAKIKGSVIFGGSDWASSKWAYDVILWDKIHVRGITFYNSKTDKLHSFKYHLNKDEVRIARIEEIYTLITEEDYHNAKFKPHMLNEKNSEKGYLFF